MIGAEGTGLHHDDLLGEAVHPHMEERIQMELMTTLLQPGRYGGFNRPIFPGSQPVSCLIHRFLCYLFDSQSACCSNCIGDTATVDCAHGRQQYLASVLDNKRGSAR